MPEARRERGREEEKKKKRRKKQREKCVWGGGSLENLKDQKVGTRRMIQTALCACVSTCVFPVWSQLEIVAELSKQPNTDRECVLLWVFARNVKSFQTEQIS